MRRELRAQQRLVHRRGAQQQRVLGLEAQFAGHDPRLAIQRGIIEQPRHPPVRQLVAARVLWMLFGDAIGEGMRQQVAQRMRRHRGRRRCIAAQAPSPLFRCGVDRGQRRTAGIRGHAPIAECGQCLPALGQCITARAQRIARFHQRRQIAGQCDACGGIGCQQHRGKSRMRAQRQHAPAARGELAVAQCIQPLQQVPARRQCARWRRIDEAQLAAAPGRQLQRQRGQLHLRDLRLALRLQPLRLRPQPIGEAFRHTAGAAGALVGAGLRDRHAVQPREAAVGIETRLARQAAVDHHAHAGQGD